VTTGTAAPPGISPVALAAELGLPEPTGEQAAVIGAPLGPGLVVAGAGSGKTETMAARVVWLVANGLVSPERVLGLTFTRKAAGELGHRVRHRLAQLRARGLVAGPGHRALDDGDGDGPGEPAVSTYHAYAGRIVAEHGLRLGVEPSAQLLTEARAWQLAEAVVRGYDGPMDDVAHQPATVANSVIALSGELSEHLREPSDLVAAHAALDSALRRLDLASATRGQPRMYADVKKMLGIQRARLQLLPLVEAYARRKHAAEAMDFGDQVAVAARLARQFPEVRRLERTRYRVVLLDEYQDTSHAQLELLRALFGDGHPVTAVGDPCQSIYSWRGAAAGNLVRFLEHFGGPGTPAVGQVPVSHHALTTSWRNDGRILGVANRLSDALRRGGLAVPELSARQGAEAAGRVVAARHATIDDETAWLADELAAVWGGNPARVAAGRRPLTVAVLARARAQLERIEAALRERDVPVDVVGLGGLLDRPEIQDVVATLTVLADPAAGSALMRLLTGARWRIGPRDLDALGRRARTLARRRLAGTEGGVGTAGPARGRGAGEPEPDDVDGRSIIEALADLGPPPAYSPVGHARLLTLHRELDGLRRRTAAQPLPELVADVERTLGIDVEVAARAAAEQALVRGHLDRFLDVAADFAAGAPAATLGGFLAYLAAARERERGLDPEVPRTSSPGDAVQLLTVHGAKGLEWDVVAVPGLVQDTFPSTKGTGDVWTSSAGCLPFPLRGDAADLPVLDLSGAQEHIDARDALHRFVDGWRARVLLEERRLAYVAVTRARSVLLCSGYVWAEGVRPRPVSPFLEEVAAACRAGGGEVACWADDPPKGATNPMGRAVRRASWPYDPLGARRPALEAAAALVAEVGAGIRRHGPAALTEEERAAGADWAAEADLLLAERDRRATRGVVDVAVPDALSVSQLVTLRRDPAELARQVRRPLPYAPAPLARRGTAFHLWLEQRFGAVRLLDVDELPGAADGGAAPDTDLEALQAAFLASAWAERTPAEVEVPFSTTVGGVVVRGRMDAVYGPDTQGRWEVVDWKTGRRPTGADADGAAVQLAAYRLAWAALRGVPAEQVGAAFHYVRTDETVRPVDLLDESGLAALVLGLPVAEATA